LVRISLLTAGALVLASVPGIAAAAPAGTGVVKAPASTSATKTPPLSTTPATTAKAAGTATTAKVGSGPASGAKKTAAAPGTTTAKHPKAGVAGDLDNEKGSPGIHLPHSGGGLKTKLASIATTTQGQLVAAATPAAAQAAAAQASVATAALAANDPCQTTPVNAVACENSKVGTPDTVWDVSGAGDTALAGFATDISVNVGQTVHFKVKSTGAYRLDVYRVGYYNGDGARLITSFNPQVPFPQTQPTCQKFPDTTGLMDCGNWAESASWAVPSTAVSGVYFARLTRISTGNGSMVPFIVRNDASHSSILYQTSDTTWEAYNQWGDQSSPTNPNNWGPGLGNSLYVCNDACPPGSPALYKSAYAVSYNRPFDTRTTPDGQDFLFSAEFSMIKFLERNGYDVTYTTGADSDRSGALIKNHSTFISSGHDEYWSGGQRANVEAARDAGVNLAFFSGNESFWKTRWEGSKAGPAASYRTLITYKDTHFDALIDPTGTWTGTWRDPRFSPPGDGGRPENALSGVAYMVDPPTDFNITVAAKFAKLRFWRNTAVSRLTTGSVTLADATLGYEFDADLDNGFRPAGLFHVSEQTENVQSKLQDYGNTVGPGSVTHSMTLYRAASGALVFGAGTVQWSFGLDADHDGPQSSEDPTMQQATINLLADMGAQPSTLMTGMVTATKSTDTTKPTSSVTSTAHAVVGTPYTIAGTAADVGGVVGGIEVSTDGGTSWHPASGTTSWTYSYTPSSPGSVSVKVRATDDSGNIQSALTSATLTVDPRTCPCTLFGNVTPDTPQVADASAYELGMRFRSTVAGTITGVRFYKGTNNTGTHTGSLWSNTGQRLATGTFTGETASGWQTLTFASAAPVTANTTYVVSYHTDAGFYADQIGAFDGKSIYSAPLFAPPDGADGANGVYHVGTSGFPTDTHGSANYYVDVVFSGDPSSDTAPPDVSSVSPLNTANSVPLASTVGVTFTKPVNGSTLQFSVSANGTAVPASVVVSQGGLAATLTPNSPLAAGTQYTVRVVASDLAGHTMTTPYTSTFRTGAAQPPAGTCPCTIWSDQQQPSVVTANDANAVELGVKIKASSNGYVSGVRFFKGPQNTGKHTGTVWSASGQALATATFVNETASGWQQVAFDPPVAVTAGTTYVVSYHTNGFYSYTAGGLNSAVSYGPLTALANGTEGADGVYNYGPGGAFPDSGNGANYWVDPVFQTTPPGPQPPAVASVTPVEGESGAALSVPISATFNKDVQAATVNFSVTAGATSVTGTTTYDSPSRTATFTPTSAALTAGKTYAVSVTATGTNGLAMTGPYSWSFSTGTPATCPCSLFSTATTPTVPSAVDTGGFELGTRFRSDQSGFVTGVRFYKGTGNTGTHTGSLWSNTGQRLAAVTFSGETATGWQSATFDGPVAIQGGTDYVVSYHTDTGHYSYDMFYFNQDTNVAPLHALATGPNGANGVSAVGASSFPTNTYQGTNYWVDVVFATSATDNRPPAVTATTPAAGATGVPPATNPSATFSEAINPSSLVMSVTSGGSAVAGAAAYDAASRTATFTPTANLAEGTSYTGSVRASDVAGNAMTAPVTWSFTTGTPSACPCSFFGTEVPDHPTSNDTTDIEVGLRFTSDVARSVTGMRFYKGDGNTGTHLGTLWSATGTVLAQGTFTNETATGWQTLTFATPVAIQANTVYVVSYHASNGNWPYAPHYFDGGLNKQTLHAPEPNGVFNLGAGFPQNSANNTNYYVDVIVQ
jgi:hypothetical protein